MLVCTVIVNVQSVVTLSYSIIKCVILALRYYIKWSSLAHFHHKLSCLLGVYCYSVRPSVML